MFTPLRDLAHFCCKCLQLSAISSTFGIKTQEMHTTASTTHRSAAAFCVLERGHACHLYICSCIFTRSILDVRHVQYVQLLKYVKYVLYSMYCTVSIVQYVQHVKYVFYSMYSMLSLYSMYACTYVLVTLYRVPSK